LLSLLFFFEDDFSVRLKKSNTHKIWEKQSRKRDFGADVINKAAKNQK
jgi:hypothetical protein